MRAEQLTAVQGAAATAALARWTDLAIVPALSRSASERRTRTSASHARHRSTACVDVMRIWPGSSAAR